MGSCGRKLKCNSCGIISIEEAILSATNPFDKTTTITGCPVCNDVIGFTEICDEPGCVLDAVCGFQSPIGGYRTTCSKHIMSAEGDA